jgi:pimeloyl-ACP methyl ester carboxylesterase
VPELITNDGVRIHYEDHGGGSPVVFLPGWSMSSRWFDQQAAALVDDYRVLQVDPRGQGRSGHPGHGYRVARSAHDLNELLESLDLRDVVVVAWSLACSSVFSFWELFRSRRVRGLVFTAFTPVMVVRHDWEWGYGDDPRDVIDAIRSDRETFVGALVPGMFHEYEPGAEELSWMLESTMQASPRGVELIQWDHCFADWRDVLPTIDVPVLVVEGEHDKNTPWEAGKYVADAVPDGRFELFAHSSHVPFYEEPDRFTAVLRDFLASLPVQPA